MGTHRSDDDLLGELPALADTIEAADAAYKRRLSVWQTLTRRGVDRAVIAGASRVGTTAIGFQLHKARKAAAKRGAARKSAASKRKDPATSS